MDELNQKRLSKAKRISNRISRLPFIRTVILNGSLATGHSRLSSDIDILIIAKDNRIFTARFFVLLYSIIHNIKRSSNPAKPHAGKFCFNYFLTESFLQIPTGRSEQIDRYCAENYSRSKFMSGEIKHFNNFMAENSDLFKQFGLVASSLQPAAKNELPTKNYQLFTNIGDWLESILKNIQIKKIQKDPITAKYPDLIVFNDRELRFHPPKEEITNNQGAITN